MYLSTHLIVPYFINSNGEIKRPEHLIAWWSRIFSFYVPDETDRIELRFLCRLYRDSLKPPPLYTIFPTPRYPMLNGLMEKLNSVFEKDPKKAPKIVFIMKGTFQAKANAAGNHSAQVIIQYPMKMIGAGQTETFLSGYGFEIKGKRAVEHVELKEMTTSRAYGNGLYDNNGLSFLCDRITFTKCGGIGVSLCDTRGRLINCLITQCEMSGIFCGRNALIELEGSQTKVDKNVKVINDGDEYYYMGLHTCDISSTVRFLSPLTKESVVTNTCNGMDYCCTGSGTIETVDSF
jgi:hypothetical protein